MPLYRHESQALKYSPTTMQLVCTLLPLLLLLLVLPPCEAGVNEKRLLEDLLKHYVKEERPVWDHEKPIELKVQCHMIISTAVICISIKF